MRWGELEGLERRKKKSENNVIIISKKLKKI